MFGKDKDNNKDTQKRTNTRRVAKAKLAFSSTPSVSSHTNTTKENHGKQELGDSSAAAVNNSDSNSNTQTPAATQARPTTRAHNIKAAAPSSVSANVTTSNIAPIISSHSANTTPISTAVIGSSTSSAPVVASSSSSSPSGLSDVDQAKILADTLKGELRFPREIKTLSATDRELISSILTRKKLDFQQHKHEHKNLQAAAKAYWASDLADKEKLEEARSLFCAIHGEFVTISGMDIEHGFAFDKIRESQEKFLAFLNDPANDALVNAFLQEPEISNFFGRSKEEFRKDGIGLVQGTKYFYRICFNNIDNLWLICHGCNIHKSDQDSLAWFRKQKNFGQDFVDKVTERGGLHTGIIFERVGGQDTGIFLNGRPVYKGGAGMGAAAMQYFDGRHRDLLRLNKQYYASIYTKVQDEIKKIDALIASNDPMAHRKIRALERLIRAQQRSIENCKNIPGLLTNVTPTKSSSSSSNTIKSTFSPLEAVRDGNRNQEFWEGEEKARELNSLKYYLQKYFQDKEPECAEINNYIETIKMNADERRRGIDIDDVVKFCDDIEELISKLDVPSFSSAAAAWAAIRIEIEGMRKTFGKAARDESTISKLGQENRNLTQELDEARKEGAAERLAREESDRRAVAAEQEARAAKAELEALKRQMMTLLPQAQLTGGMQPPTTTLPSSTSVNNVPVIMQQQTQAIFSESAPLVSFSGAPPRTIQVAGRAAAAPYTSNIPLSSNNNSLAGPTGVTEGDTKKGSTSKPGGRGRGGLG